MAIVNSRAAIEPKTGKAAIFVNETIHSLMRKLFSNGEQGFFYDPNDLSTMYQDAAGTVPVTAVGQPVGLILDKSKGLVLGSELLPSVASMTGWVTAGQTANGSVTSNGTSITLAANGAGILSCASASLDHNKFYLFSITVSALTGTLYLENATAGKSIAIAQPGTYTTIATNVGSFYFRNSGGVCTATVTAASAKELSGNHAYQTTSASRPTLRKNAVTGANYLEFDGTDDFLQAANIDFTATDKVSLFAGVRKLSDAVTAIVAELSATVDGNTGAFRLAAPASGGHRYQYISRGSTANLALASAYAAKLAAPHSAVITAKSDINTDISSLRVNGLLEGTSASDQGTGNYGNYPLYIGRRGGTSLPFNGHIYSLIGIGRLTTDAETVALEKLIAKNTGVALSV